MGSVGWRWGRWAGGGSVGRWAGGGVGGLAVGSVCSDEERVLRSGKGGYRGFKNVSLYPPYIGNFLKPPFRPLPKQKKPITNIYLNPVLLHSKKLA